MAVEWKTPPPLTVGTRLAFVAKFLVRRLACPYQVKEHDPGGRFVMSSAEGPLPIETTYEFSDGPGGATTLRLTNRGSPRAFSWSIGPFVSGPVRRATTRDLARLNEVLEGAPPGAP
ncbi:MAG: SRPBCC family protein [Acidimicrobiales bacterium]